ncbi:hypothetical protein [Caballeronia insecticola]|uniref:hypothetical protein n=1 Tax=Caballeronia insecticola TaxID=758793 RepID=UPI0003AA6A26|nr:hypothetical protein [Caballeronia insecticola]
MKYFNRLANREFLILVALVASAMTMHVKQHITEKQAQPVQSSQRMCEPSVASLNKARAMPADCGMRAKVRSVRSTVSWV